MPKKGFKHTKESKEKMRLAKLGGTLTEEHKNKIGLASKRVGISPETRAKMVASRKANGNYVFSDEQKKKLSIARQKRVITAETRAKIGAKTKGHKYALGYKHTDEEKEKKRQLMLGNKLSLGVSPSEETRAKLSEASKKIWQSPELRNKLAKAQREALHIFPNKPEKALLSLLNEVNPNEWAFVGDGQLIIAGKNPDIANVNGKKLLVELYGDYWHRNDNPEDRINLFALYGYRTLIIWGRELKDIETVKEKIKEFING